MVRYDRKTLHPVHMAIKSFTQDSKAFSGLVGRRIFSEAGLKTVAGLAALAVLIPLPHILTPQFTPLIAILQVGIGMAGSIIGASTGDNLFSARSTSPGKAALANAGYFIGVISLVCTLQSGVRALVDTDHTKDKTAYTVPEATTNLVKP